MDNLFGDDEPDDLIDAGIEAEIDAAAPAQGAELTPRDNPDLYGHEEAEARLLADFNAGRLPHAFIFAGPAGIGKATLAYRLARFLFAQGGDNAAGLFGEPEKPDSLYVAPNHPSFRRVVSGGHADLQVVQREMDEKKGRLKKNISAEDARNIAPFLRKTAAEGGWRVVIVDGAEDLNPFSQNALLKILEEPPKKAVLILTTTQAGALLPTIRSRCRMVALDPLNDGIVEKLIDQFHPNLPPDEKLILTRIGEGSFGKALRFYDDEGITLYKTLLTVLSPLPELDMVAVHDLADKIARNTSEDVFFTACDILTGWCDRLVRAHARGLPMQDVLPGDARIFTRIAAAFPPRHFLDCGEKLARLFATAQGLNLDKRQTLISAFLTLQQPGFQAIAV